MNKLHRKIEYALMAMQQIKDKSPDKITAKLVADASHAPFDAVARSLQLLTQRGILKSEQGVAGGYFLAKPMTEITMLDLIEAIEGPTKIAKCLQSKSSCDIQSACNIISPVQSLNQKLNQFYQNLSLNEVLK